MPELRLRYLRLICVSNAFADLWESVFDGGFTTDAWTAGPNAMTVALGDVTPKWEAHTPLRRAIDRRQATVELDAVTAVALGISADELATIYRTQFPVLNGYDRNAYLFDADGRLVPKAILTAWRQRGDLSAEERTTAHPGSGIMYEYLQPFYSRDREADLRQAHAVFAERWDSRRSNST
jgi:hypothetical protein